MTPTYEYRCFAINEQGGINISAVVAGATSEGWEPHLLAYRDAYNGTLICRRRVQASVEVEK